jgi:hypothetical protein
VAKLTALQTPHTIWLEQDVCGTMGDVRRKDTTGLFQPQSHQFKETSGVFNPQSSPSAYREAKASRPGHDLLAANHPLPVDAACRAGRIS